MKTRIAVLGTPAQANLDNSGKAGVFSGQINLSHSFASKFTDPLFMSGGC